MQTIDQLGRLRAEIATLQAEAKALEEQLKADGEGIIEGAMFRGTVAVFERESVDWKTVAKKLGPSRQLVRAHTSHSTTVRLTVAARKKEAA